MLPIPRRSSPEEFDSLISAARASPATPEDVAELALALADSGERLTWPQGCAATADVASTGGPGSLSTLITPLALRALGLQVPKLAVPGRPAGAIDTLGTVPGYRTHLSSREVQDQLAATGFAHFQADARFVPMDAELFSYRRSVGAIDVPALAAASLLSKKIAVGVKRAGLDVRVGPHGNFGRTADEARGNGRLFCAAARLVGIDAVVFLTEQPTPQQPWIGRGESLLAVAAAVGAVELAEDGGWLVGHVERCCRMALETAGTGARLPRAAELRMALEMHLRSQGANWEAFAVRVGQTATAPRVPILAQRTGSAHVDLGRIRTVLVDRQGRPDAEPFTDPAGVEVVVTDGVRVELGAVLARVRDDGGAAAAADLAERLASAFDVGVSKADIGTVDMEVIRA